jgi:hypothetical protein
MVIKLPGLSNMDLHGFWNDQNLHIAIYALPSNAKSHAPSLRQEIIHFSLVHTSHPNFPEHLQPAS